jgi:SAM-dependent methyltransferase
MTIPTRRTARDLSARRPDTLAAVTRGGHSATGSYSREYYDEIAGGAQRSAEAVVPIVLQIAPVTTAVDVGCGNGAWLRALAQLGVRDLVGLDGPWAAPHDGAPYEFRAVDLAEPFDAGRRFDLALCLEVAEHLPERAAGGFVRRVAALAPVVLFSASVPGQGGEGHVNEQWPGYWVERFAACGYTVVDSLRERIWDDGAIEYWYRQNALFFVAADALSTPAWQAEAARARRGPLAIAHPELVEAYAAQAAAPRPSLAARVARRLAPGRRRRAG